MAIIILMWMYESTVSDGEKKAQYYQVKKKGPRCTNAPLKAHQGRTTRLMKWIRTT